jgi:hypothetical protein
LPTVLFVRIYGKSIKFYLSASISPKLMFLNSCKSVLLKCQYSVKDCHWVENLQVNLGKVVIESLLNSIIDCNSKIKANLTKINFQEQNRAKNILL